MLCVCMRTLLAMGLHQPTTASAGVLARSPPARRLNVATLVCLPPSHALAANQRWRAIEPALHSVGAESRAVSCPKTSSECYSGDDLLPTGKGNQTLASCCDLCHRTSGCVGIVLTTRKGQPGLTCYPKSKMERPSGGDCTSGTMGQPFPPHPPPPAPLPPSPSPAPLPPSPPVGAPVQLVHGATGLCLEARQPSGNVEAVVCEPTVPGHSVRPSQRFQFHADGSITDGFGACLSVDGGAHGIDANVVATNRSCISSTCSPNHNCVAWLRRADGTLALPGVKGCLDAGSGGGVSDGTDVRFAPAGLAAPSGPTQAYCNASAPSWGGAVLKIGAIYHMWVLTMAAGSGNDPNTGDPFVRTGRIDHAVASQPTGPYKCVQEDVIPHTKGYVGNPQIFRDIRTKRLLLAVIGTTCSVYSSMDADGPWECAGNVTLYNNPTLVPRPDGTVVLFCHDCAHDPVGYGDSAMGVLGKSATGPWIEWKAPATGQDGDPTRQGQLYIHPMEE